MANTAYAIDGMKPVPVEPVPGVVQGLFSDEGCATWVVYDDAGVVGRKHLDLAALPEKAEVLDVMGNDPRRDNRKTWEIGIQPLFIISRQLSARTLAARSQRAIR